MLFSSLTFIFVFLPLILASYYLMPRKGRNVLLLIFSLLFYAWGGVSYSVIILLSILVNFFLARAISNSATQKKRWLIVGLIFNLLLLAIFKYLVFFIQNINWISDSVFNQPDLIGEVKIALPLGISFFTFQQISMLWDLYRSESQQKVGFLQTALYISFFPQLIAGPIVRYNSIIDQIRSRKETITLMNSGIQRFIIGLFKKTVIANTCAQIVDTMLKNDVDQLDSSAAWLGIIAYAFQIYYDFSGYTDMAIGLGRMFGFRILENFNFPYSATSIRDFWRRWHISLSTWFRDYLYIPLGGSRKSVPRTYVNLMIVFILTGFWHGATWSFMFWGVFHGAFLIIERLGWENQLKKLPKIVGWSYTFVVVLIGWVFFRIEDFPDAFLFVQKLFGLGGEGSIAGIGYLDSERLLILFLAAFGSIPVWKNLIKPLIASIEEKSVFVIGKQLAIIGLFLYSVMMINSGSYNPFIYFRF